jgi:excisionase family DNA binding protein
MRRKPKPTATPKPLDTRTRVEPAWPLDQWARRPFLSIDEAAAVCRVNPATIRRLILRGRIKAVRVGRVIRVVTASLRAYLDAGVSS